MRNLLREELYKSRKSVTTYICAGLILLILLLDLVDNIASSIGGASVFWQDIQASIPFFVDAAEFIVVLSAVFIGTEFSRGTIKNYVALGVSRNKIYIAKLLKVLGTYLAIIVLCHILTFAVTPFLSSGSSYDGKGFVLYLYGLLTILQQACFYTFIAFLFRNVSGVILVYFGVNILETAVIAFCVAFGGDLAEGIINAIAYSCYSWQINIQASAIIGGIGFLEGFFTIIIPLVICGLSVCFGMISFNKRDIK